MTDMKEEIDEIILVCSTDGIIKKVLYGKMEFCDFFRPGDFFLKLVDSGSLAKSLTFFTELKKNRIITNHEVNFVCHNNVVTFVLSGAHENEDLIILVASRQIDFLAYDEIMAINNEQVNLFRMAIKEKVDREQQVENYEFKYFDEISRLNNELMNVQRELAKKNNELTQLNAKLEELTIRDSLTNLFNKRYLYPKFEEERLRSARFQYPIALAMIDLNNFKQINDLQGHQEGDRVLIKFAELSRLYTRDGLDYVFRIGGDEFLILLTHCEEETANEIVKRIDKEYRKVNPISSIAFGVSSFIGNSNQNMEEILKEIDAKMYEHKKRVKEEAHVSQ